MPQGPTSNWAQSIRYRLGPLSAGKALPSSHSRKAPPVRGTSPAVIPVEQPTKFEFVVNLRAAKTIGHEVPAGQVLRADTVVE
jgi:hypothetical protein